MPDTYKRAVQVIARAKMEPPERSLAQQMSALAYANEIRILRAQLKVRIKAGEETAVSVIGDPPDWCETMKVVDVLLAAPRLGPVKANKILVRCRISPSKTIGGLTARQRFEILGLLQ